MMEEFLDTHGEDSELHEFSDIWDKPSIVNSDDGSHSRPSIHSHHHQSDTDFQHHQPVSGYDPNDIFYSPVLSLNVNVDGTPLMSPPDPVDLPPDFAMPPSFYTPQQSPINLGLHVSSSQQNLQGQPTQNQAQPRPNARRSGSVGKVVKQSPLSRPRWPPHRLSRGEEDELGDLEKIPPSYMPSQHHMTDPAEKAIDGSHQSSSAVTPAMIMNISNGNGASNGPGEVDDILQERLRSAIEATTASSISSSRASNASASIISTNSADSTPRISSRATSSTDSNNVKQEDNVKSANSSLVPLESNSIGGDASKSNYHQIIDGTHHHLGFTSPEKLSSDVKSKKTSHKIAEQERRNRINSGLMELGKLVSPISPDAPLSSKAAIVEAAVEYVHHLHKRIEELESFTNQRRHPNDPAHSSTPASAIASAPSSTPASATASASVSGSAQSSPQSSIT